MATTTENDVGDELVSDHREALHLLSQISNSLSWRHKRSPRRPAVRALQNAPADNSSEQLMTRPWAVLARDASWRCATGSRGATAKNRSSHLTQCTEIFCGWAFRSERLSQASQCDVQATVRVVTVSDFGHRSNAFRGLLLQIVHGNLPRCYFRVTRIAIGNTRATPHDSRAASQCCSCISTGTTTRTNPTGITTTIVAARTNLVHPTSRDRTEMRTGGTVHAITKSAAPAGRSAGRGLTSPHWCSPAQVGQVIGR